MGKIPEEIVMSNFERFNIGNLTKHIKSIVSRNSKLSNDIQAAILAAAYHMEEHGDTSYLTMLVKGVSSVNADGSVSLSAAGSRIGKFAMDHLPIKWDKGSQAFKMKQGWQEFDFETAATLMESRKWDYYEQASADKAFEAEKEWKAVVAKIKRIIRDTPEDQRETVAYKNAEAAAKMFALEA